MKTLVLEVLSGPEMVAVGRVQVDHIYLLAPSKPINGCVQETRRFRHSKGSDCWPSQEQKCHSLTPASVGKHLWNQFKL